MFSKDPVVYANPHPREQDYGYTGGHPSNQRNASLRMRSPNAQQQSITASEAEQSSSAIDMRGTTGNNATQSGYNPQALPQRF